MEFSTLTSKGQFTIPALIRQTLALHAGDRLNCFVEEDRLVIIPAKSSIKNLKGCVPKPKHPVSIEVMHEALLSEAAFRAQDNT